MESTFIIIALVIAVIILAYFFVKTKNEISGIKDKAMSDIDEIRTECENEKRNLIEKKQIGNRVCTPKMCR